MFVIATAGHVDHGKSTLVRALTGMEPDRWAEERARGMTIDLGFAWTTLEQGPTVAFVDVPGHERFIGNMLAGLGPAPAVMMVVGADEGWRPQSAEHLAAIDALGLRHGLLVVTRSDLADPGPATTQALEHVSHSSLGSVEAVQVSGRTGAGMDTLRNSLYRLVSRLPEPCTTDRVRLWVDRTFTVRGSGTVVTGTLTAGMLSVGDPLVLGGKRLRIKGLQTLGHPVDDVQAVSRVAVNLRGASAQEIPRGSALLTPDAWVLASEVDVRITPAVAEVPANGVLHLGSGAFPVRIRPLADNVVRLTLVTPLPLEPGDRAILRNPGLRRLEGGVEILDVAPPLLHRRGAAARRGRDLSTTDGLPDLQHQVDRRGAVRAEELRRLGIDVDRPAQVRREGGWLVTPRQWEDWAARLLTSLERNDSAHPLQPGLSLAAARRSAGVPDADLFRRLAAAAGLAVIDGRVQRPGSQPTLGAAEAGVAELENSLRHHAFAAPERPDLIRLKLGRSELAAAERIGRILRLSDDVVLLPSAPGLALELLRDLPQPFTTSAARAALQTTRRVAIPLLEHLDRLGWTRSVQPGSRVVHKL
ncbi:MAG: selenocysteine-specific translation elongation factor [Nakamurella sp.]